MGLAPDGKAPGALPIPLTRLVANPRSGLPLRGDIAFLTLTAGMALGLFAQIGLVAHLFSLMTPVLGAQQAGVAMGLATALAIAGRTLVGWIIPRGVDRRLVACASCAVQMTGSMAFIAAAGSSIPLLWLGIALFGIGFGNSTSLPPLIAQVEFVDEDVPRVVALIVAISQGAYAFAPATFGVIRSFTLHAEGATSGAAPHLFAAAALAPGLAIAAFAVGRRRRPAL
jgi:MFS family permease